MKKQSGFTLIELVIVVVILGFLAVTAIPKFLDLTDQAKKANVEGMAGGFATGISLTRAQWEAEGRDKNGDINFTNYDGSVLFLTSPVSNDDPLLRPGYPIGDAAVTSQKAQVGNMSVENCLYVWNNILSQPPSITGTSADIDDNDYFVVQSAGTGTNANNTCIFYLTASLDKSNGTVSTPSTTAEGNNFTYDPASSTVAITINNN